MNKFDCKQAAHPGSLLRIGSSSRVTASLVLALAALGLPQCGGSTPEAETPASVPPSTPAPAPASEAPAADGAALDEEERLDSNESAVEGAPAAPAPQFQDDTPRVEAPRKERAKADDEPADVGLAGSYSLPKALAAIEHFDAQLSAAIEASTPDCPGAEGFRRTVCQLAERICSLESDLPSSGAERHCGDSRARCSAATSRYRQSCQP